MKLTVENGCFSYGKTPVLKNIGLEVNSGELLAVLGPNGAGKTTLLRCILGFLRWSSGKSMLDGQDISGMAHESLWRKLAYVPQARQASAAYSVEEMVLLGRGSRINVFSKPGMEDVRAAREAMERLGIQALADKKCSQLSGGQFQLALIARALAAQPEVLVLDEPESNLDFKNQLLVLNVMSELVKNGMACVFNTHYPAHALQRATGALLLGMDGRFVFGGATAVVTEQNIQAAFGVKAVIGDIETEHNVLRDVLPVSLWNGGGELAVANDARRIAVLAIITSDNATGEQINSLLHEYNRFLIGRMGFPYRSCGLYIINVTLDANESVIRELTAKLEGIKGVSVKATYAKGLFDGTPPG